MAVYNKFTTFCLPPILLIFATSNSQALSMYLVLVIHEVLAKFKTKDACKNIQSFLVPAY